MKTSQTKNQQKPVVQTKGITNPNTYKAPLKPTVSMGITNAKENVGDNSFGLSRGAGQGWVGTAATKTTVEPKATTKKEPWTQEYVMGSKEVKKPVRPMSSKGGPNIQQSARQPMVVQQNLEECKDCGRKFNEKTIARHEKICKKVFGQKRKVFNSAKQRIVSKEQVQILKSTVLHNLENQGKYREEETRQVSSAMPQWKRQSLAFRMAMKQAKGLAQTPQEAQLAQQIRETASNMKLCKYCNRRFNDTAAEKHIPFCERKYKEANIRKPNRK